MSNRPDSEYLDLTYELAEQQAPPLAPPLPPKTQPTYHYADERVELEQEQQYAEPILVVSSTITQPKQHEQPEPILINNDKKRLVRRLPRVNNAATGLCGLLGLFGMVGLVPQQQSTKAEIEAAAEASVAAAAGVICTPGELVWWTGKDIPQGYVAADGALLLQNDFPELFNAVGFLYGPAPGPNRQMLFGVPDLLTERRFIRMGENRGHTEESSIDASQLSATVHDPGHDHNSAKTLVVSGQNTFSTSLEAEDQPDLETYSTLTKDTGGTGITVDIVGTGSETRPVAVELFAIICSGPSHNTNAG